MATLYASNLVSFDNGLFSLTAETQEYLLKKSPNYFGYFWDMMYDNSETFSLKNLESAIKKNKSQVYEEQALFNTHTYDAEKVRKFTQSMHSVSMSSASFWPTKISLTQYHKALDIGGGSGAHSIGMVTNWSNLNSTIFDLPEVCSLAADYIQQYGLSSRIETCAGNMWEDNFPDADLHLYSNVLHDWPTEKNLFLAKKSYDALPKGGRIIIHEILYNDVGPGPLAAAASSLVMLGWTEGRQYSGKEFSLLLTQAGFQHVEVIPSFGYHSIVTAIKS
ncbi:methyltransferase [Limnobaculum xujianqingii]|uniref:methyltransferase n=1 Tax=Limnobaculum xujianqingii TaxID=2738837 RepID=UPI001E495495|nr:methyltransferase [Limnobaculum xujianqingii]